MTTIGAITAATATPFTSLVQLADTGTASAAARSSAGTDFGTAITGALEHLSAVQGKADDLAVQAATGTLADVHDYTIAATEASLATELTVAVRNKAVEAFTQIMNLPL